MHVQLRPVRRRAASAADGPGGRVPRMEGERNWTQLEECARVPRARLQRGIGGQRARCVSPKPRATCARARRSSHAIIINSPILAGTNVQAH